MVSLPRSVLTYLLLLGQLVWLLAVAPPALAIAPVTAAQPPCHAAPGHQAPGHQAQGHQAQDHQAQASADKVVAEIMSCCDEDQCQHLKCHGGGALVSQPASPVTAPDATERPAVESHSPVYFSLPLDKPPKLS